MAALNPIIIAYISNMVDKQMRQWDKDVKVALWSCLPWVDTVSFPQNFRIPDFKMFKGTRNLKQHIAHFLSRCGPVINGHPPPMVYFIYNYLCSL